MGRFDSGLAAWAVLTSCVDMHPAGSLVDCFDSCRCYLDVTDAALRLLQAAGGALEPPPVEQLAQIYVCGVVRKSVSLSWLDRLTLWSGGGQCQRGCN